MVVNCVRNTVINGKLTDAEMTAFNQEVTNKIYTFLKMGLFSDDLEDAAMFMGLMNLNYPHGGDDPKLDKSFLDALKRWQANFTWIR